MKLLLSSFSFSAQQNFVTKRLQQISQKALALQFDKSQLVEIKPTNSQELMDSLVPNFFAQSGSFKFYELQKDYKKIFTDEQNQNTVSNTFLQLNIPLGSDLKLRNQFTKLSTNQVRIGRLLEVLDGLVGLVAFRYCHVDLDHYENRKLNMATLSVDNFIVHSQNILNNQDLVLDCYVTYVGNSSIQIQTNLFQNSQLVTSVQFMMVARDINDYSKSIKVPVLNIQDENINLQELEKIRFEIGKQNHYDRLNQYNKSLERDYPNDEESELLHKMFIEKINGILLNSTKIEKNILMQPQDRNSHGRAFGGFIMREIFELGWLCAYKHNKGRMFNVFHIFNIQFHNPVPIGSSVQITSRIVYVEGNIMIVQVQLITNNYENEIEIHKLCTEVYMAFESDKQINQVIPKTYEEGVAFLQGRRHYRNIQ